MKPDDESAEGRGAGEAGDQAEGQGEEELNDKGRAVKANVTWPDGTPNTEDKKIKLVTVGPRSRRAAGRALSSPARSPSASLGRPGATRAARRLVDGGDRVAPRVPRRQNGARQHHAPPRPDSPCPLRRRFGFRLRFQRLARDRRVRPPYLSGNAGHGMNDSGWSRRTASVSLAVRVAVPEHRAAVDQAVDADPDRMLVRPRRCFAIYPSPSGGVRAATTRRGGGPARRTAPGAPGGGSGPRRSPRRSTRSSAAIRAGSPTHATTTACRPRLARRRRRVKLVRRILIPRAITAAVSLAVLRPGVRPPPVRPAAVSTPGRAKPVGGGSAPPPTGKESGDLWEGARSPARLASRASTGIRSEPTDRSRPFWKRARAAPDRVHRLAGDAELAGHLGDAEVPPSCRVVPMTGPSLPCAPVESRGSRRSTRSVCAVAQ